MCKNLNFIANYHDSRDSWRDSLAEEFEGVVSNLLRSGPILALSTGSDHAWLEEDTFKHHIVLGKVEENLSPNLFGYFESPVNSMLTIKQDLWLNNWNQSIVLRDHTSKDYLMPNNVIKTVLYKISLHLT